MNALLYFSLQTLILLSCVAVPITDGKHNHRLHVLIINYFIFFFFCGTVNFLWKTDSLNLFRNYTRHSQGVFNPLHVQFHVV